MLARPLAIMANAGIQDTAATIVVMEEVDVDLNRSDNFFLF